MVTLSIFGLIDPPISDEFRIVVIITVFLSVAAFFMSGFALWLFYKFYRDTIKPLPKLVLQTTETNISLKLVNLGNNPFYIHKFFVSREDRVEGSVMTFLPLINEGTGYMSYTPVVEGRKVVPDQSVSIFEFDLAMQRSGISLQDIQQVIDHLEGLLIEAQCEDIGKKYITTIQKKIIIDPLNWQIPKEK